jgi:diguanylate cyclase (GGDEF)-like protein/PAS domain S-box-containing protein
MRAVRLLRERYGRTFSRTTLAIALSCLALIVLAGSLTVRRIAFEREAAIANEMQKNSNLAIAIEEQTIRTLKAVDQVILFVRHQYREEGSRLDIRRLIADGEIDDSSFTDVGIIDEHGDRIMGRVDRKPVHVADREHFKFHAQNSDDVLHISPPELGRITGKWGIHVTRRINKDDGSFGGIVLVSLDPGYFIRFYEQADLGQQGVVALVGLDGIARARYANHRGTFGDDMRKTRLFTQQKERAIGQFVGSGAVDGVVRLLAYRTLEDYPLVVVVGTSQAEALAPFNKYERDYYFLAFALITALVAFFATAWIGTVSRHRLAMESLSRTETQFRATYNQAAVGMARIALDGRFVQVNPALCRMLGYSEEELLVRTVGAVTHAEDRAAVEDEFRQKMRAAPSVETSLPEAEKRCVCKDGSTIWVITAITLALDGAGNPDYFVCVVQDITRRKELQERLQFQASYDGLTRLPNRVLFYDRVRQALSAARRKSRVAAVLFIDLDRFKHVNDTFGHDAGDQLLSEVAERVTGRIRVEDTMGRIGGDEFAVVLPEVNSDQDAAYVARKIVDALALPFSLEGKDVFVTSSIGIAMFPADSQDADTLIKQADTAMLRAKALGRNNYQFYTPEINEFRLERIQMEADLRGALQRREFLLYFQPKLSLRTRRITGVEALLRWRHPQRGLALPGDFIPLLEESGLIVEAGEWVLNRACAQVREWIQAGETPVPIAVNLSAKQFQGQDIAGAVERALRAQEVEPRLLEIEITESAAMQKADGTIVTLDKLKKQGVQVAIDDFGTGYSSLSYLQRFPVDALKLDRSFVSALPRDRSGVSISLAVITMAHSLGLKVIAEGVETSEQVAFLAEHGCDEMQGYYLSRPLPAEDCREFLRAHRAGTAAGFAPER